MKLRVALLACASLCFTASAVAEPPIGSRLGERLEKSRGREGPDAVQTAHQMAGCVLAKRGTAGRDFLAARSEDTLEIFGKRVRGDFPDCMAVLPGNDYVEEVWLNIPPDILRGDIAEEYLKRDRSSVARLQPLPIQHKYSRTWFGFTGRNKSVDEMAACVADTNPAAIMAIIDTQPFSGAEGAAFKNIIPSLGVCLVAGTTLDGKPEPLRAALAEALYQRVTNPGESVIEPTSTAAVQPQH